MVKGAKRLSADAFGYRPGNSATDLAQAGIAVEEFTKSFDTF
jgi:hypothetical protein